MQLYCFLDVTSGPDVVFPGLSVGVRRRPLRRRRLCLGLPFLPALAHSDAKVPELRQDLAQTRWHGGLGMDAGPGR